MVDAIDWSALSPKRFEEFCVEALWTLGFLNVRQIGGSGDRGRDILCEREVTYIEQFSERFSWVVQCKHTTRLGKASIAKDLAAALEHRPDVWWLMTSASVSPDFHDFLTKQSRAGLQPFRVGYLDGHLLSRLCVRFPVLIDKFLPHVAKNREHTAISAMSIMSKRQYADAATLLLNSEHLNWCRAQYLLACCFAQSAANGDKRHTALRQAWTYLTQAVKKNYLAYLHAKFGWPLDRCRTQIFGDPELATLRARDERKFRRIIGHAEEESGGGCFPAEVTVSTLDNAVSICAVKVGDLVKSLATTAGASTAGRITAIRRNDASLIAMINGRLAATSSQPIHTSTGWKEVRELQVGDLLSTMQGPEFLSRIVWRRATEPVYDLTVEPNHQYYVNGFLVHNKI